MEKWAETRHNSAHLYISALRTLEDICEFEGQPKLHHEFETNLSYSERILSQKRRQVVATY